MAKKTNTHYCYSTPDGYHVSESEIKEPGYTLVCTGTYADCVAATGAVEAAPDTTEE